MKPIIGIIILGVLCLGLLSSYIAIIVYSKRKERWERITSYYRSDE